MKKTATAAALLALLPFANANASAPELEARLKKQYPSTKIASVRDSAIRGVYEVILGKNVAYTDESGRYMIFGHMFDMKEQKDLTAGVLESLNRVDASLLPREDAIKTVRGNGERSVFVFSDPDCPYCKKLEVELGKLDNVTIYTMLFPLDSLHPAARGKSESVWCAPDRVAAWDALMLQGKQPETRRCDNPVARNVALGDSMGINGTPTMIFEDGTMASGALQAAAIERRLSDAAARRSESKPAAVTTKGEN